MKKWAAFLLTLVLLGSAAWAAEPEDDPAYHMHSQDLSITIDRNDVHIRLTVGDWIETHSELNMSLLSAIEDSNNFGPQDSYETDISAPPEVGDVLEVTLTVPADMNYPARVYIVAQNIDGYGIPLCDTTLERDSNGHPSFPLSPVLDHNLEKSEQWVNFLQGDPAPEVQALSDEICAGAKSDMEKVERIHDWVCDNIYYDFLSFYFSEGTIVNGVAVQTAYDSVGVLELRRTVCSGYATLTKDLLNAQRIPCIEVTGYALGLSSPEAWTEEILSKPKMTNHAWNEVWVDGRWVVLDTTWDSRNRYESETLQVKGDSRRSYFDPSPALLAVDHRIGTRSGEGEVPSEWARDEIFEGMISFLYPDEQVGHYAEEITRQRFCTLLVSLVEAASGMDIEDYLAAKSRTAKDVFFDTDDADVLAAYALGIVKGKGVQSGGSGELYFDTYGRITRQEAAVMLTNCAKLLGVTGGQGRQFTDSGNIASWAAEGVAFLSSLADGGNAVMGDSGNGAFAPLGSFTAEQAMVSVLRLYHCAAGNGGA